MRFIPMDKPYIFFQRKYAYCRQTTWNSIASNCGTFIDFGYVYRYLHVYVYVCVFIYVYMLWTIYLFIPVSSPYSFISTSRTQDNMFENVLVAYRNVLKEDLFPLHRLDVETTGLMMIGKSKSFTSYFNRLQKSHRVLKRYKCIVSFHDVDSTNIQALLSPNRVIVHQQEKSRYSPKIFFSLNEHDTMSNTPRANAPQVTPPIPPVPALSTLECKLEVLSVSKIMVKSASSWKCWVDDLEAECTPFDRLLDATVSGVIEDSVTTYQGGSRNENIILHRRQIEESESVKHFQKGMHSWLERYLDSDGKSLRDANVGFAEVEVRLHTGRTHQCRGQIEALGSRLHIAGDR